MSRGNELMNGNQRPTDFSSLADSYCCYMYYLSDLNRLNFDPKTKDVAVLARIFHYFMHMRAKTIFGF